MKTIFTIMLAFIVLAASAQVKKVFNKDHTKSWYESPRPGFKSDTAVYAKGEVVIDTIYRDTCLTLSIGTRTLFNDNCRDSIIKHMDKCVYWTVINFDKNSFQMNTGYRCWDETIKIGVGCHNFSVGYNPLCYYLKSDKKTKVKDKVLNCVLL